MMRMSVHSLCPAGMSPEIEDHGAGTGACGKRGNLRQWFHRAEGHKEERPGWGSPFVICLESWFLIRVVQGLSAISGNILVVTPG